MLLASAILHSQLYLQRHLLCRMTLFGRVAAATNERWLAPPWSMTES